MQLVNGDLKTSSIGVVYFFSRGVFAPTRLFKLHSRNTGTYDYYKFDLYPYIPSRVVGCRTVVIRVVFGLRRGWVGQQEEKRGAGTGCLSPFNHP